MDELWSKFIVKLRQHNPFFACLALFATLVENENTDISVTSGQELYINPAFLKQIKEKEAFSYLLHQLLHLALQHTQRGFGRDVQVWNIAADIVVNNIIAESTNWPIAPQTASNSRFINCSVEDVYFQLMEQHKVSQPSMPGSGTDDPDPDSGDVETADSDNQPCQDTDTSDVIGNGFDSDSGSDSDSNAASGAIDGSANQSGSAGAQKGVGATQATHQTHVVEPQQGTDSRGSGLDRETLDSYGAHCDLVDSEATATDVALNSSKEINQKYWEDALLHAEVATNAKMQGSIPGCMLREFAKIDQSKIDWRKELWRFVSDRRSDFNEFDTRHLFKGLYLEELRVDGLTLAVAIDTSGSISHKELGIFIKELKAITGLHADVTVMLYYCDASVDGPHVLQRNDKPEFKPTGGCGTSFVPFFNSLEALSLTDKPDCIIYFTDGYGDFPEQAPVQPTFWLITEQGIDHDTVPFGRAVSVPTSSYA